ncbi:hypothetical protein AAC387_Pa02g5090 [Persea americana]
MSLFWARRDDLSLSLPSRLLFLFFFFLFCFFVFCCFGHKEDENSASSHPFTVLHSHPPSSHHHHGHDHDDCLSKSKKLREEKAEEEDFVELLGLFDSDHRHGHVLSRHDHNHHQLSKLGLWINAMGCSLLVSLASLICLIILPVVLLQEKPSKVAADSLAAFGAGAMLGDAFLHQLPHDFGGEHFHPHTHHLDHVHDQVHHHGHSQSHSHSLKDLSVGLSVLSGIVLFIQVEKVVRFVDDLSGKGEHAWGHGHHHHRHNHSSSKKLKDDSGSGDDSNAPLIETKNGSVSEMASDMNQLGGISDEYLNDEKHSQHQTLLRKLLGYLNLVSDGVHNFTDGMALGSAFLLHGSVGGWSRTLFLLAHELPQEVGDFEILVGSGFSVSKAIFFNFLSALVALAGTALALILGQDPGQSSLIEENNGFTAGGFIYIAVAGVLPEINSGSITFKSTVIQLMALTLGMAVALCISLVE